jgi:hypothetical protein
MFYENLDERWAQSPQQWSPGKSTTRVQPAEYLSSKESAVRFRSTLAAIDDAVGDILRGSPFRRPALFYTLYCAVYHINFELPRSSRLPLGGTELTGVRKLGLRRAVGNLTEYFEDRQSRSPIMAEFYESSARQTDNLAPRSNRLRMLIKLIANSR